MNKKLLFALNGLPSYGNHGGAQTCIALIDYFKRHGYEVTVLSLFDSSENNPYLKYKVQNEGYLKDLGVKLRYVFYKNSELDLRRRSRGIIKKFISPMENDFYVWSHLKDELKELMNDFEYDIVFSYHFEPLSFFSEKLNAIHIGAIGDPTHTPIESQYNYYKSSHSVLSYKLMLHTFFAKRVYFPTMKSMLERCDIRAAFAGHYSDWLKKQFKNRDSYYFRTPVVDPFGSAQLSQSTKENLRGDTFRILLLGAITGTATKVGVEYFFSKVYPLLTQKLKTPFEIHIIGGGRIPVKIEKIVNQDHRIIVRGRVDPIGDEISRADAFIVPTPLDLGIRVRIITAMAFSAPIVAHESNAKGIPELIDGENSLLSLNPEKMSEDIVLLTNPLKNKELSRAARLTYDKFFSIEAAGSLIEKCLDEYNKNL